MERDEEREPPLVIPIDVLAAFCAAALLLAFLPGPDNLFVLTQSAMHGASTGLVLTLGLCTGLVVYSVAVAFGVAAVFEATPQAFTALKTAGAAYLLYLAHGALRAEPAPLDGGARVDPRQAYRRGIVMNLTNPKIAVFFIAFLPQFTSPARGSVSTQLLVLGGLFILCSLAAFAIIASAAGLLSGWLRRSDRGQVILNRVAAVVFVGLAIKLVTTPTH